jgi:hypothetical protein
VNRSRLRTLLRRASRHPLLEPLAWRVRARRRTRVSVEPVEKVGDRRIRVAVPPRIRAAESELAAIAGAERIVAGPWRGSVGVELLYWIPFLRWFRERFGVDASRIVAVSRHGAELWYAGVCGTYATTAPEGTQLSPALLDAVCGAYRSEREALVHVLDRLAYERIPSQVGSREGVVAWPAIAGIDATDLDENADAGSVTAAIDGAALLAGPWDGRLLLGPLLGVPTLALTPLESASPDLDLAYRAARALDTALITVDPGQLDVVTRLAARVAV